MARLTWENVAAPNFSGVGDSLRTAASLMQNATSGFAGALGDFEKSSQQQAGNQLMQRALGMTDQQSLNAALQNGTMFDGAGNVDRASLEFIANRGRNLLSNQAAAQNMDISGYNLDRTKIDNQRGDAAYNAGPEIANIVTQYNALSSSGKHAEAQELLKTSAPTLAAARISPERIMNWDSQGRQASTYSMDFNQTLDKYNKWQEGVGREADTSTRADYIANNSANRAQALDIAAKLPNLSVKDRTAIQERIGALGDNFWPQMSEQQQRAAAAGLTPRDVNRTIAQSAPNPGGPQQAAPAGRSRFLTVMDREEGGGRYNTLYANAQKPGGRFAGVDVSKMTIGEAVNFAKSGEYGNWVKGQTKAKEFATPMGRFQFVGRTLEATAKKMGLDPNTPFNEKTQNALAMFHAKDTISGPRTMDGKIAALRDQWEGFRKADRSEMVAIVNELEGTTVDTSVDGPIAGGSGGVPQPTASSVLAGAASTPEDEPERSVMARSSNTPADDLLTGAASSDGSTPSGGSNQPATGNQPGPTETAEASSVAGAEATTGANMTVPPGGIPGSIDEVMNAPASAPVGGGSGISSDPDTGRQLLGANAGPVGGGNVGAAGLNRGNNSTTLPGYDMPNRFIAENMFDATANVRQVIAGLDEQPRRNAAEEGNRLKEGPLKDMNPDHIRDQLDELTKIVKDPRVAGAIMEDQVRGGRGVSDWWNNRSQSVDMDTARSIAKAIADVNLSTGRTGASNMLNTAAEVRQTQVTATEARNYLAQARADLVAAKAGGNPAVIRDAQANYDDAVQLVNELERNIYDQGNRATNFPYSTMDMGSDGRPVERVSAANQRTPAVRTPPPAARAGAYAGYDAESLANAQRLLLQR